MKFTKQDRSSFVILSASFVILSASFVILSASFVILSAAKDLARWAARCCAQHDITDFGR